MKFKLVLIAFFYLLVKTADGQGLVRGKITNDNGESVIGATVTLKSNPSYGTISDFDGNFEIKINSSEPEILVISFISFKTIEETVNPQNGEVLIINFSLESSIKDIEGVTIEAKAERSRDFFMERVKMNSASSIDYISAQTIKRTGDSYVVGAVQRVSGVATNRGGFITVRGIGDRYVKTSLNNSVIPTLDPFTNNIRLDIFPTSLVDNVLISKTASADQPGDWSGAHISVLTKDFPDKLTVNIETSVGYNSQSTLNDFVTSDRSSTDWMGFDRDLRDIEHENYSTVNAIPSQYEELAALGLGPFFQSMGVTGSWLAGSNIGETYFKLGLVELGLLPQALFNDPTAVALAKSDYLKGTYKDDAYMTINRDAVQSSKIFPNNWDTYYRSAPLDFSQSFSIGNQTRFMGRTLGFLVGFRYGSSTRYDQNSVANRALITANGENAIEWEAEQEVSNATNGWSALASLSYKLNANNSIGFLFMPNITGVNNIRNTAITGLTQTYDYTFRKSQFYEQRQQMIYQLKSEHYLPASKVKVEVSASYADANSSAPDFKEFLYFADDLTDGGFEYIVDIKESDTHRYYRYLSEDLIDSRISAEFPINKDPAISRKFKTGAFFQKNFRDSEQFDYRVIYNGGGDLVFEDNDLEEFFGAPDYDFSRDPSTGYITIKKFHEEVGNPANHIIGHQQISGGFLMVDYNLNYRWRFAGGVRVEHSDIFTDVYEYDKLGYGEDDPRRQFGGDLFIVKPVSLVKLDLLPSMNLIYKLRYDRNSPVNLRFNYSKSLARPGIRELSDAIVFDYEVQDFVFGNSSLKPVSINNYDFRLESFFNSGEYFSVSLFYKHFKDHIELVNSNQGFTWQNVDISRVLGLELEGKKDISRNFEARMNFTLVDSRTEYIQYRLEARNGVRGLIPVDTLSRTMFGQAPYVINAMLIYKADSIGLVLSAGYNLQGEKLVFTSINGTPDIFEQPRHLIDFKAAKTVGKHFAISARVQNILNEPIVRAYGYTDGTSLDFDRFTFGTNYTLSLSYKL